MDIKLIEQCEEQLKDQFKIAEDTALYNQKKVLDAFKKNKVALRHFSGSTGYGYGDDYHDESYRRRIKNFFLSLTRKVKR